MSNTCKRCGAPEREWVCWCRDGSNKWALDLDLHDEYPKTWGEPNRVRLSSNGCCGRCNIVAERER